jgi:hypothetical protein
MCQVLDKDTINIEILKCCRIYTLNEYFHFLSFLEIAHR